MSFKKSFDKYCWLYLIIIVLIVVFLLFKLNQGFITGHASGSPPTFTEIVNNRNLLTAEFDSLQNTLNQKKRDYQICITNLIDLYADIDAREDPAHQQAITDKTAECYDKYNYLVSNSDYEFNALCGNLEFRYNRLMDENAESLSYERNEALSREGLTYEDLNGNEALRDRIFADSKDQNDFAIDMLKEQSRIFDFCDNMNAIFIQGKYNKRVDKEQ